MCFRQVPHFHVQIRGLWFIGVYETVPTSPQFKPPEWPDQLGRNPSEILRFRKLKSCSRKEIRDLLKIRADRIARKQRRR